jgi:hypothetical protein
MFAMISADFRPIFTFVVPLVDVFDGMCLTYLAAI